MGLQSHRNTPLTLALIFTDHTYIHICTYNVSSAANELLFTYRSVYWLFRVLRLFSIERNTAVNNYTSKELEDVGLFGFIVSSRHESECTGKDCVHPQSEYMISDATVSGHSKCWLPVSSEMEKQLDCKDVTYINEHAHRHTYTKWYCECNVADEYSKVGHGRFLPHRLQLITLKGFWRCCITPRITGFLDFDRRFGNSVRFCPQDIVLFLG
jgi:hypothetical protein